MSSLYVRNSVEARITAWGKYTLVPMYNDECNAPGDLNPWLAVQYPGSTEEQKSIGAPGQNVWREVGTFMVHVVVPTGTGQQDMLSMAEEVRNLFRGQTFDGIRCYQADPPNTEENATIRSDGNWFGAVVAVDYDYDIHA